MDWHNKSVSEVALELGTDAAKGLTPDQAARMTEKYGPNALAEHDKESRLRKLSKQFTEFIILVLIGAAVIAGVLGEWIDSLAIMAIVVLNGVIGFMQEEKAGKGMGALKKLSAPEAKILRGGEPAVIPASELVPGDLILLESGDHVPADCRIIESKLLRVQEARVTGEATPRE